MKVSTKIEKKELIGLNMSINNLGDKGIFKIGELMNGSWRLEYLSIGGNNIGDEGVEVIVDAIEKTKTLKYLDLSITQYNSIRS
jgi:hypothetical protein